MNSRVGLGIAWAAIWLTTGLGWRTALATCDTTAPVLTDFGLSPTSINTALEAQTVNCSMTLTDALPGVASATCTLTSPAPAYAYEHSCSAVLTSGTPQNGTWSCAITFPRYSETGTWRADFSIGAGTTPGVVATDGLGNNARINPGSEGFPSAVSIVSVSDFIAPALTSFTVTPGAVNVSAAAQVVTCDMTLTDAKSGVDVATCALSAPGLLQFATCDAVAPTSGTRNNGLFSCVATIPRYARAGTWTATVYPSDQVGNRANIPSATTLVVTAAPEDTVMPSLVLAASDFNPKTISVGAGPKSVVCTMGVADSPAGVDTANCQFISSDFQVQSCTAGAPISGTRNNGTFECTVIIPRYSEGGDWRVQANLTDLVGLESTTVFGPRLTVDCAAGELETTCRFAANKTSLTWDAVAGATQYNLYRGALTNLVDANSDHLPDGGYGTCQNSRDSILTDTTFVDTDIPTVAAKGLFYLVAYRSGGAEQGLGANSFGTARGVAATCP